MNTRRTKLTDQQKRVLKWIADGCPDGVMIGTTHKKSSNALRDRALVTISKRGGVWSAAITEAGKYFLKHGKHPGAETVRTAGRHQAGARPIVTVRKPPREPIDPDDLVKRIRDQGGTLIISATSRELTPERRAAYRRAIFEINEQQLAGPTARLRHTGRDHGDLALRLVETHVDGSVGDEGIWTPEELANARGFVEQLRASANVLLVPDGDEVKRLDRLATVAQSGGLLAIGESIKHDRPAWGDDRELGTAILLHRDFKPSVVPVTITVQSRVAKYSPAVAWYRSEPDRHEVTKPHLPRACLVLEAIAREASRRGWELRANTEVMDRANGFVRRIRFVEGQFKVMVGAKGYWLRIKERSAPGGKHVGYSYPDKRPAWQQRRTTEFVSTGSLEIETAVGRYGDQSIRTLDERLPLLFAALEAQVLGDDNQAALDIRLAELRKEARQQLADQRRRRWEQARTAAIEQVIENHRASVLRDQIERWELVGRIDRFLKAAGDGADIEPRWAEWIRAYQARIDPMAAQMEMPESPAFTADDLTPFMHGLDPRSPNPPLPRIR